MFDWWNPFSNLGSQAAKVAVDAWIAAWLSLWNAGLWLLRLVLSWMDAWLTPDLSGDGPGHDLYQTTLWIAAVVVVIMVMIQLGVSVGEAIVRLRAYAYAHDRPLGEVARDIVERRLTLERDVP